MSKVSGHSSSLSPPDPPFWFLSKGPMALGLGEVLDPVKISRKTKHQTAPENGFVFFRVPPFGVHGLKGTQQEMKPNGLNGPNGPNIDQGTRANHVSWSRHARRWLSLW